MQYACQPDITRAAASTSLDLRKEYVSKKAEFSQKEGARGIYGAGRAEADLRHVQVIRINEYQHPCYSKDSVKHKECKQCLSEPDETEREEGRGRGKRKTEEERKWILGQADVGGGGKKMIASVRTCRAATVCT